MKKFAGKLLAWYDESGRHDLPWQLQADPYRVWVSEIMLQQTRVQTVIPYYRCFMRRFPDVYSLADAGIDEVLHLWSGLGYYARARNLHKTALIICREYGGVFPEEITELVALPGIGRSTAGAILAISRGRRHPILDGNVRRVLVRLYGITGSPRDRQTEAELWRIAEQLTPEARVADYTQAIMDLGATLCTRTRPACGQCPLRSDCIARREGMQSSLPVSPKQASLPVKQAVFAIIQNRHGEILLERRPLSGIWGGLWSLPECPPGEDIPAWIKKEFGSTVGDLKMQEPLRHTFSHFHLDILPCRARLESEGAAVRDRRDICWYSPEQPVAVGLAAPVKKLVHMIYSPVSGTDS